MPSKRWDFSPQFYYPLTYNTTKRRQYRLAAMSFTFYQSLSHTQDTDRPFSFLRVRSKDTSVCEGGSDTVISGLAALTTSKPTNGCKDLCPCGPAATQQDRGDKKQDFAHSALFSNLQLHKQNIITSCHSGMQNKLVMLNIIKHIKRFFYPLFSIKLYE